MRIPHSGHSNSRIVNKKTCSLSSVDFYEQRVVCEVQAFNGFVANILNVFYRIKNSLIGSNYESANVIVQTYLRVAIQRWYFFCNYIKTKFIVSATFSWIV